MEHMDDTCLVYDVDDAVRHIEARCSLKKEIIEKALEFEGEYVELVSEEGSDIYWEEEIAYIAERTGLDVETLDKILLLNEDYMRSVGIVEELPESVMEEIAEIIRSSGKTVTED